MCVCVRACARACVSFLQWIPLTHVGLDHSSFDTVTVPLGTLPWPFEPRTRLDIGRLPLTKGSSVCVSQERWRENCNASDWLGHVLEQDVVNAHAPHCYSATSCECCLHNQCSTLLCITRRGARFARPLLHPICIFYHIDLATYLLASSGDEATYLHTCYRVLLWKGRPCSHEEVIVG